MTAQRTPGPWGSFRLGTRHYIGPQVEGNVIDGQCIAMVEFPNFHPDGLQAAAIEADANAVFIVTACNAHDGLVAENARLLEALELIRTQPIGHTEEHLRNDVAAMARIARKALAQ